MCEEGGRGFRGELGKMLKGKNSVVLVPGMAWATAAPIRGWRLASSCRTLSDAYPGLYAVAEVLNVGVCQRG